MCTVIEYMAWVFNIFFYIKYSTVYFFLHLFSVYLYYFALLDTQQTSGARITSCFFLLYLGWEYTRINTTIRRVFHKVRQSSLIRFSSQPVERQATHNITARLLTQNISEEIVRKCSFVNRRLNFEPFSFSFGILLVLIIRSRNLF